MKPFFEKASLSILIHMPVTSHAVSDKKLETIHLYEYNPIIGSGIA